jgi:hypothetical protein
MVFRPESGKRKCALWKLADVDAGAVKSYGRKNNACAGTIGQSSVKDGGECINSAM